MATYLSKISFTEQGIENIGKTTARAKEFESAASQLGATIHHTFWTLGEDDGLIIFDVADDSAATALMLKLSVQGNVHTSTARAFTAAEMDAILSKASLG